MEWDGISWQPQDIFRDMHQGLKDVEVKVAGFSESVVGLTKVRFPASPGSHSEVEAMISKPKEIIWLVGANLTVWKSLKLDAQRNHVILELEGILEILRDYGKAESQRR